MKKQTKVQQLEEDLKDHEKALEIAIEVVSELFKRLERQELKIKRLEKIKCHKK